MSGTFSTIARMIQERSMTTGEFADLLGMRKEQLEDRLLQMEHQGYLSRVKEIIPPGSGSSCGHCCTMCSSQGGSCLPVQFVLTRKGEHLAGMDEETGLSQKPGRN